MTEGKSTSSELAPAGEPEAIRYFRQAIMSGRHWYPALLEAMRLWNIHEETHGGRIYKYLIDGEAFDWLLLAERLCETVHGLITDDEKSTFLFHGEPPIELSREQFRELFGRVKYHQYLNYFYGVTVEEALLLAVQEEIRKERWAAGLGKETDAVTNEAYRRIYGTTKTILLRTLRKERGYPQLKSVSFAELKEFTYWLFKYRLKHCDKAKIASDTKKALTWLKKQGLSRQVSKHDFKQEFVEILPADESI